MKTITHSSYSLLVIEIMSCSSFEPNTGETLAEHLSGENLQCFPSPEPIHSTGTFLTNSSFSSCTRPYSPALSIDYYGKAFSGRPFPGVHFIDQLQFQNYGIECYYESILLLGRKRCSLWFSTIKTILVFSFDSTILEWRRRLFIFLIVVCSDLQDSALFRAPIQEDLLSASNERVSTSSFYSSLSLALP